MLIHAFSVGGRRGNPSFVIMPDRIDSAACIAIAQREQCEVTAITKQAEGMQLHFFTPGGEIAFCGHGTLAAATRLSMLHGRRHHVFRIGDYFVQVTAEGKDRWSYLQSQATAIELDDADALAATLQALGLPPQHATLGRSHGAPREKLLLKLRNATALRDISLDPIRRDALCERLGVTGIYALAAAPISPHLQARHFPLHCGTQEDMATGGTAPAAIRFAGFDTWNGEIVIDQGGANCDRARLIVADSNVPGMCKVMGECA